MNKNLNNNWIRKKAAKHTKEDLITYKIGRARQENNDWKQIEKLQRYIRNFEQISLEHQWDWQKDEGTIV